MYINEFNVTESQLDVHGCWRLSSLLTTLQDAATADAAGMGLSRDDLIRQGAFWIVNRTSVWMDEAVGTGKLRLQSWHAAVRGASWTRHYVLFRNDVPVIRASSVWAAVSLSLPRRLVKLDPIEPVVTDVEVPAPAHVRAGELTPCGTREIRYADLDQNAHLNNARAVDLALDALKFAEGEHRFIREAHIHYAGESRYGDVLECLSGKKDAYECFEARVEGKPAFSAALRFDTF